MSLSNFGRKKAGAGKLDTNARFWKILGAGKCVRKFDFFGNLWYNKRLGVELGAQVSPKCNLKFDKEVKAGCATKI